MIAADQSVRLADRLRRLLAAGSAVLVLILTILAASPAAHGLLHRDGAQTAGDDACAVVMFASGVSLPVGPIAILPPTTLRADVSPATATEVFLISPRYLRQPERGPPTSLVG